MTEIKIIRTIYWTFIQKRNYLIEIIKKKIIKYDGKGRRFIRPTSNPPKMVKRNRKGQSDKCDDLRKNLRHKQKKQTTIKKPFKGC